MNIVHNNIIDKALSYPILIEALREAFTTMSAITPQRTHISYDGKVNIDPSVLLCMPSWIPFHNLGLKVATVSPGNAEMNLPSVNGVYLLFDAATGQCSHIFDASMITVRRTAATSALASTFLSRSQSEVLLIVGTGAMAPELIRAHATVRPIKKVLVWGRDFNKAKEVCELSFPDHIVLEPIKNLGGSIGEADIISCATLSKNPLIEGAMVSEGQHIDLVGSYLPTSREGDNALVKKSKIFIDHEGALHESGDLVVPLQDKLITQADIKATLHQLCNNPKIGRSDDSEITFFKSVGHAMEDLVAAQLISKSI